MFFGRDAGNRAPTGQGQTVGVQHAKLRSGQPGLAFGGSRFHECLQFAQHATEQLCVVRLERRLYFGQVRELLRHEDVRERRVHRVVHPGQGGDGLCTGDGFGGQEARLREELVQMQHDGHDLRDDLALVHQHRHLATRVDGFVLVAVLLALVQFDHVGFKLGAAHLEQHMGYKRTGARGEIQFQAHRKSPRVFIGAPVWQVLAQRPQLQVRQPQVWRHWLWVVWPRTQQVCWLGLLTPQAQRMPCREV